MKYKKLNGTEDANLVEASEKEVWGKEPEKIMEPEHECQMVEYMKEKVIFCVF
jgi:hypothetical protein